MNKSTYSKIWAYMNNIIKCMNYIWKEYETIKWTKWNNHTKNLHRTPTTRFPVHEFPTQENELLIVSRECINTYSNDIKTVFLLHVVLSQHCRPRFFLREGICSIFWNGRAPSFGGKGVCTISGKGGEVF